MKYFIFDMDETIAELYSVYYFIASLKLKELIVDSNKTNRLQDRISSGLENKLKIAYGSFVDRIAEEEKSSLPLGILRPGILGIMADLKKLQSNGVVRKVAIYSNNGHLESLQLIRDIIHKSIGSNSLIGDCIHWNHPMRGEERLTQEGAANKTWSVLKNILVSGPCGAPNTIDPKDIYFFDDLKHEKMEETHYIQVPPYETKASFERIEDIYVDALIAANLTDTEKQEFYRLVSKVLLGKQTPLNTLNDILYQFWIHTKGTIAPKVRLSSEGDNGIKMMKAVVDILDIRSGGKRLRSGSTEGSCRKTRRVKRRRFNKSKKARRE